MHRSRGPESKTWRFNSAGSTSHERAIVGSFALAEAAGQTLPPAVADLLEVAGAIHVIDRAVRRPTLCAGIGSWSREFEVVIGVRDVERWNRPEVRTSLTELLAWLTDDSWAIEFTNRAASAVPAECVQFLFPSNADVDSVALFSGGVDSVAGLALAHQDGRRPMLLSAQSNRRMMAGQIEVLDALRTRAGIEPAHVGVDLYLDHVRSPEASQRARGFGFLSLGAALLELIGENELLVFENGVGAINLPYSAAQAGAHGTRAMHPATLSRAAELFSLLFDRAVRVSNPNQFRTKAEMCGALPKDVQLLLPLARSCDTAYATRLSPDSCGACTSCLLRRQALIAVGLEHIDAATDVRFDAFAPTALLDGAAYPLRAMLSQAARLATAIASPNPWHAICAEFPDITLAVTGLHDTTNASSELIDVYMRYVREWQAFPASITGRYFNDGRAAA